MHWQKTTEPERVRVAKERSEITFNTTGAFWCSLIVLSSPETWQMSFSLSRFLDATNGDEARQEAIDRLAASLEIVQGQLANFVSAALGRTEV